MMRDAYTGEAQFLAWGDGPSGPWVKILLPDSDDLGPFRGMTAAKKQMAGQLLAVKIVEVEPEPEKRSPEPTEPAHAKLGPLALLAVQWARDPKFQAWAGSQFPAQLPPRPLTQEECRMLVLDTCRIGSRRELDVVPSAGEIFKREIRGPFMAYLEGES